MKFKKLISFFTAVIIVFSISSIAFAVSCPGSGDYISKSSTSVPIYDSLLKDETCGSITYNEEFTVDWVDNDWYGYQLVSVTTENGEIGFLFGELSGGGIADFPNGLFTSN